MVRVTNAMFAKSDGKFVEACSKVGLKPSRRQASKWRRGKGLAWKDGRS